MIPVSSRMFRIYIILTLMGMAAQIIPFLNFFPSSSSLSDISMPALPLDLKDYYGTTDFFLAEKYSRPFITGSLIRISTLVLAMLALISSGIGNKIEAKYGQCRIRWLARFLFFLFVYLTLYLSGMPYRLACYFHSAAFGITAMDFWTWLGVVGIRLPVPMLLFIFKYTLVFCCMYIFRQRWWLAAAVFVFVVFHGAPEFMTNRPMTPVRELSPLEKGPYRTYLENVANQAGIRLDIMVEDHSTRSNTVNCYLGGRVSNRYVVLTDTFIEHFSPQEAGVALAHELGHKNRELTATAARKILGLSELFFGFLLALMLTGRQEIGPGNGLQAVSIVVLCMIVSVNFFRPGSNAISRWDERESDHYGLELTHDADNFKKLMLKLAKINLEPIDLRAWPYYFFSRYPRVRERIAYADVFASYPNRQQEQRD